MKIATFLLVLVPLSAAGAAELGRPDLRSEEFVKRFSASYGVLSAREPQVTELETALLEKLAEMLASSPAQAQALLESALSDGKPVSAAFNHILGNLYFTNQDWTRAEEQYREGIRKFPDFQRAWNSLGALKMELEEYGAAAEALARSVELGASDAQTYGMLGYALLQARQYAAAEVAYNLALLREPSAVRCLEGKARILAEAGRHAETLAATDELLKHSPANFEYWRLQANAHLALGNSTATARSLEIAQALGSLDANALYLLGNVYLKDGMAEHALDAYLAAIKLQPKTAPSTLLRVAQSLLGQEQYDLARQLLTTLEPTAGSWTETEKVQEQLMQGRIALHDGATDKAIAAFERALEMDPIQSEGLYRLAVVLAEHEQREKARYYLEKIRGDANYEYGAQLYLAKMMVAERRFEDALAFLRTAYQLKPSAEVESLYNRVRIAAESQG